MELVEMKDAREKDFVMRLRDHPELMVRVEELVNIIDNVRGDCRRADDAEERFAEELRKIGNESMSDWASKTALREAEALEERMPELVKNGKKKSLG
jgi:hypothetical protein